MKIGDYEIRHRLDKGGMAQVWLAQRSGGGIVARSAAELVLRNRFVGQAVNNVDALRVDGSTVRVLRRTLVGAFNAAALEWVDSLEVTVCNSIAVTEGGTPPDEVDCPTGAITFTSAEGAIV